VDNKGKTIFFGIVLGAATGLVAALLLNRRATETNRTTAITSGEGLKLGVLVFGLLRAIASLAEDGKKA
jgi:gas vesicle protein